MTVAQDEEGTADNERLDDDPCNAGRNECKSIGASNANGGARVVLLPTLGLSAAFPATLRAYCQLVRRPADRLLVVDMQAGPQSRPLRLFPYALYELSEAETQSRAELALQMASEKTDKLRQLMERHGVAAFSYSLRLYHCITETWLSKPDALVLGREFDLGKSFIPELAKLIPNGLIVLP
uniref:TPP_enzyme_N domain-containing protein n=1 Tax=Macrostomum lignano TaxID=282301 RepID=A0A1I8JBI8_9PLAT